MYHLKRSIRRQAAGCAGLLCLILVVASATRCTSDSITGGETPGPEGPGPGTPGPPDPDPIDTPLRVGSVTLSPDSLTVALQDTAQLSVIVRDTDGAVIADPQVVFTVSGLKDGTVDRNGLVTGLLSGCGVGRVWAWSGGVNSNAAVITFGSPCRVVQSGSIAGKVIVGEDHGYFVPGATVSLSGAESRTETTNALGSFTFNDLAPGTYSVAATPVAERRGLECQSVSANVQTSRTAIYISCSFRHPRGNEIEGSWSYSRRLLVSQTGSCPLPLPQTGAGSMTFDAGNNTIAIVGLDPALAVIGPYDADSHSYTGTGSAMLGDGSSVQTDVTGDFGFYPWELGVPSVFSATWTRRHRDQGGNLVCTETYEAGGFQVS